MSHQNIINRLTCGITLVIPASPAELPCGHIFEYAAITQWYMTTKDDHAAAHCPTCRNQFYLRDIRLSLFALFVINELNNAQITPNVESIIQQNHIDNEIDDDDDNDNHHQEPVMYRIEFPINDESYSTNVSGRTTPDLDSLSTVSSNHSEPISQDEQPLTTLSLFGSRSISIPSLGQAFMDMSSLIVEPSHRLIVRPVFVNPQSSNYDLLFTVVNAMNQQFISRIFHSNTHNYYSLPIFAYSYQYASTDISDLARYLAARGYFVYDLFLVSSRTNINNFIMLSTPYDVTTIQHRLCRHLRR